MADPPTSPADRWDPVYYSTSLGFIARLSAPLQALFTPSPTDHVLDIGCGDGALTVVLREKVAQGRVVGLDSSAAMISHARETYKPSGGSLSFKVHDCSRLDLKPRGLGDDDGWEGAWDWVFSNSTFHWILGQPDNRETLLPNISKLLKPGGHVVFEFGGAGHVADAITALTAAMVHFGVPAEQRKIVNPWMFPSAEWMRGKLKGAGFEVVKCETEYRPTKVSLEDGSIEGFVRQLGFMFLDAIAPEEGEKRDEVVKWVCELLNESLERQEDGTRWLGFVRLRVLARRPV
ncbi:hypothetical protein PRZ48_008162 [Zasmidium cellare]|uniref:Methyltransferase type 12 domain-containing protein n=1 Tax=Zasmidium cellare TaxID=395010 RepID=A0ABR0EFD2_ZASCE|nr:hypothetical protein PRZ48_008162 [Zasmidium cellare]